MEGSRPAVPAEPGTLKASLVAIPGKSSFYHQEHKKWSLKELMYGFLFRH